MNNDDDRISPHPSNDHALEARIVAWVMGEASEFEIAELTRAIAERPALAAFKARIENTHRLVREAAGPEKTPLKLSAERRSTLMAALGISSQLTADDESSHQIPFNQTEAIATKVPAAASAAAGKANSSGKSSVLAYPMARRSSRKSSAWFRGLSVACSIALMFVVVQVTVFAPKSYQRKEEAITARESAKFASEQMARRKAYAVARADMLKKQRSERSAKEENPLAVQLPSMDSAEPKFFKSERGDLKKSAMSDSAPEVWNAYNVTLDQPVFDTHVRMAAQSNVVLGVATPQKSGDGVTNNSLTPSYSDQNGGRGFVSSAQDSALTSPINEQPIPLDSFAVVESPDSGGYTASSTLAGTRIKTSLPELQKGPHSILYGMGSPSGIIDTSQGRAVEKSDSNFPANSPTKNYVSTEAPAPATNDADILSPFERSSEPRDGYTATPNLAGTRINTDLKDTASAVTVVTNKFLQDTGGKKDESLLNYTNSSEIAGLNGNFANAPAAPAAEKPADFEAAKPVPAAAPMPPAPAGKEKLDSTDEQSARTQPVSTFSLHVSDVSFRLSADAIAAGEKPDPSSIRPEEFYNAFDYGDPAPAKGETVSCRIEQSAHPTKQQRNLVRIAMRVPSTGRAVTQPLHLTILLDTSGSMQRRDRAASVKDAVASLISLLKADDQITLIGFARTPHLLAEGVAGDKAQQIVSIVTKTPAEGGTNLDAALTLAGELAQRHQISN
ncbi:MAG TPA: von Willebrand factor type A domain-containing protein, partial [Opitutaceae bacterium]